MPDESLEGFLALAEHNTKATQEALPAGWAKLAAIHNAYKTLIEGLYNTPDYHVGMFLLRAHAAYLAACRMAVAGQTVESYMASRGCLEAALYGVYIHRHPDAMATWLERHQDEKSIKACRRRFRLPDLLDFLDGLDRAVGERLRLLYERTIDFGGHPNERAIFQTMRKRAEAGEVVMEMHYLTGEPLVIGAAVRTTAQAGLCALEAFRNVFPERFDIIGLSDGIADLRVGL